MVDRTESSWCAPDEYRFTLPNGRRLRIRPLRPGELHLVRDLCSRLTLRTRHLRFFSPSPVVPETLMRMLADVEDTRRMAMIAELDEGDRRVVALGNAIAIDDDRAEVGLVVADAWQRQGIGVILAARLLRAADARGFKQFLVHGLWNNPAVRPLLSHTAEVVSANMRYGVAEIHFIRRPFADSVSTDPACSQGSAPWSAAVDSHPAVERAYQRILLAKGGGVK
jgi:GNAT superfamily N-acetyltransferase